jgi:hypothetical protein
MTTAMGLIVESDAGNVRVGHHLKYDVLKEKFVRLTTAREQSGGKTF